MTTSNMYLENYTLEGEKLKIYTYPSPVLKKVAEPVTDFNQELQELVKNMLYTMYKAPGVGLAAPQVGVSKRIFVLDTDFDREERDKADGSTEMIYSNFKPMVVINPVFTTKQGEQLYEEGCLSFPGIYEKVNRADKVQVKFQDMFGNFHEIEADGLLSVCLQHENDHLEGIVFLERLSQLKQNFLRKKFLKNKKKSS